jgi:hypothetical protein
VHPWIPDVFHMAEKLDRSRSLRYEQAEDVPEVVLRGYSGLRGRE